MWCFCFANTPKWGKASNVLNKLHAYLIQYALLEPWYKSGPYCGYLETKLRTLNQIFALLQNSNLDHY